MPVRAFLFKAFSSFLYRYTLIKLIYIQIHDQNFPPLSFRPITYTLCQYKSALYFSIAYYTDYWITYHYYCSDFLHSGILIHLVVILEQPTLLLCIGNPIYLNPYCQIHYIKIIMI